MSRLGKTFAHPTFCPCPKPLKNQPEEVKFKICPSRKLKQSTTSERRSRTPTRNDLANSVKMVSSFLFLNPHEHLEKQKRRGRDEKRSFYSGPIRGQTNKIATTVALILVHENNIPAT